MLFSLLLFSLPVQSELLETLQPIKFLLMHNDSKLAIKYLPIKTTNALTKDNTNMNTKNQRDKSKYPFDCCVKMIKY